MTCPTALFRIPLSFFDPSTLNVRDAPFEALEASLPPCTIDGHEQDVRAKQSRGEEMRGAYRRRRSFGLPDPPLRLECPLDRKRNRHYGASNVDKVCVSRPLREFHARPHALSRKSFRPRPLFGLGTDLPDQGPVGGGVPEVWVAGEISNFARPQSGHCYLTLKDDRAQLRR